MLHQHNHYHLEEKFIYSICSLFLFDIPYKGGGLSQTRVLYFVAVLPQVAVQADHGFHEPHCPSTKGKEESSCDDFYIANRHT
jgi:hypothetical protein